MNYRLLSKILGLLLLLLSAAMAGCLGYALAFEEHHAGMDAIDAFGISVFVTALSGGILLWVGRRARREILRKEGIAIVGLGWLICSLFGALPYLLGNPHLTLPEAIFESTSGFTTTGATVIPDLTEHPRSVLLWRSLTQWLGGLGILVLFVALLSYLGVGSKALFQHESSAKSGEGLRARIQDVAARLWQIYLLLTLVCIAGLIALGMSPFEAVCHAFTTLSTGGFGTRNESIAAFDNVWIELWLVLFMILGGISFMLYAWLLRGRWDRWKSDEETRVYLVLLLLATAVIGADLVFAAGHAEPLQAFRESLFQVVSIMTTSGFATADFDQWPPFSKILLLLLMAVGGCAGSTAGSMKVSRWILFFKIVHAEIVRAFRPNLVFSVRLNGNRVDDQVKIQTVFFIALAGTVAAAGSALICLFEPQFDILSAVAAVFACLFNIGPGLGLVGPTQNFSAMSPASQLLLSLLMVFGRLEFFALLVLFMPSLWRKY